jgi:hypothetical protein
MRMLPPRRSRRAQATEQILLVAFVKQKSRTVDLDRFASGLGDLLGP